MAESRSNQLGPYQILDQIAQGAYGEVLRARHVGPAGFQRILAIKRLRPHVLADASAVRAFENEARIGGLLLHHNIAQTLEFRQDEGLYYLVMEYVDGISFQDLVLNHRQLGRPIPDEVVVELIGQACDGLHHAHEALGPDGQPLKLIHRDIKPSNLMLTRTGVVKVMDFGIARVDNQNLTDAGFIKGTPRYLSPEMITRNTVLDRRSDLFSLAAVFYELLALKPLFDAPNLLSLMARVRDADVGAQLKELGAARPAFARLLSRCLASVPASRFQSARELAREVRLLKRELSLEDPDLEGYALEQLGIIAARSVRKTVQASGPMAAQLGGQTGQALAGAAFGAFPGLEQSSAGPGLGGGASTLTAAPVGTSALLAHVEARAGLAESRELSKAVLPPASGPAAGAQIQSLLGPVPLTPDMLGAGTGRPSSGSSVPARPAQNGSHPSTRPVSGEIAHHALGQPAVAARVAGVAAPGTGSPGTPPWQQKPAVPMGSPPTVQLVRPSPPAVQTVGSEPGAGTGAPSSPPRGGPSSSASQPGSVSVLGSFPATSATGSPPPGAPGTGAGSAGVGGARAPGGLPPRPGGVSVPQVSVGGSTAARPAPPVDEDDDDSVQTITGRDISPYRGTPPAPAVSAVTPPQPAVVPASPNRGGMAEPVKGEASPVLAPPLPPGPQEPEDELQMEEDASPEPISHAEFSAEDWGDDEKSRVMTMEELERLKAGTPEADPSEAMLRTLSDVPLPGGGFSVRGAPPAPARERTTDPSPVQLTRAPGAQLSWRAGMVAPAPEAPDTTEPSITERFGAVTGVPARPPEPVSSRHGSMEPAKQEQPLFGASAPRTSGSARGPLPESDQSGNSSSTIRLPPPLAFAPTEPDVQQRTRLVAAPSQPAMFSAGATVPQLPPAVSRREAEPPVETKLFTVPEGQDRSAAPLGVRSTTLVAGPSEPEAVPTPERPKGETPLSRLLRPGAILVKPDSAEGGGSIHPLVILLLGLVVVSFILYLLSQL